MSRGPKCTLPGHEHYPAHACAGCRTEQLINGTPRDLPPAPEPHGRDLAAGKD